MRRLFCYGIIGRVEVARIVSRIVSIAAGILLLPRQCDILSVRFLGKYDIILSNIKKKGKTNMQLDKENIKKIRWLIAFAILLYLGVQNLHMVISTARVLLGFLFPFIIGFGIAFILNIPMKFIEHHLFGKALKQEKKTVQKLARPVSLVLSICFVICIIVIVMLVVVPELISWRQYVQCPGICR